MRLVIDCQALQTNSKNRGIGRYSLSLLRELSSRSDVSLVFILNGNFSNTLQTRKTLESFATKCSVHVWFPPALQWSAGQLNKSNRDINERSLERFISKFQPDLYLCLSFFEGYQDEAITVSLGKEPKGTKSAFILYDLIPLLNPDTYLNPNPDYKKFYIEKVEQTKSFGQAFAISESSMNEGKSRLSSEIEIFTIGAASNDFFWGTKDDPDSSRKHLLYVGGLDPRKNLKTLLKAVALLEGDPTFSSPLVVAGSFPESQATELTELAAEIGVSEKYLRIESNVSDERLKTLLQQAIALVIPSLHEGFGLTALEAMQAGTPVISSNATSLPEVVGDAGLYFDPLDFHELASKISQIVVDKTLWKKSAEKGTIQAGRFSWSTTVDKLLGAIQNEQGEQPTRRAEYEKNKLEKSNRDNLSRFVKRNPYALVAESLNTQNRSVTTIFLDVSNSLDTDLRSGIQRVTQRLASELLRSTNKDEYKIRLVTTMQGRVGFWEVQNAFQTSQEISKRAILFQPGDVFLGLDLNFQVCVGQETFINTMKSVGVHFVFFLYDLLPYEFPGFWNPTGITHVLFQKWLAFISTSDMVLCISADVKSKYENYLDHHKELESPKFISAIKLGSDGIHYKQNSQDQKLLEGKAPYILMVGSLHPIRAYEFAIESYIRATHLGLKHRLLIVGQRMAGDELIYKKIQEACLTHPGVTYLEYLSDSDLGSVLANANGFFSTGLAAGFGLTIVEALHFGTPVLTRELPITREIAGDAPTYFNCSDPDDLADALLGWAGGLQSRIRSRMELPLWKTSSEDVLKEIKKLSLFKGKEY